MVHIGSGTYPLRAGYSLRAGRGATRQEKMIQAALELCELRVLREKHGQQIADLRKSAQEACSEIGNAIGFIESLQEHVAQLDVTSNYGANLAIDAKSYLEYALELLKAGDNQQGNQEEGK